MMTTFSKEMADWEGEGYGPFVSVPQVTVLVSLAVTGTGYLELLQQGCETRHGHFMWDPFRTLVYRNGGRVPGTVGVTYVENLSTKTTVLGFDY